MLETRKSLKEQISGQEARIAELEQEIVETNEVAEKAEALAQTAATEKAEADAKVANLEAECDMLATRVSELTAAAEATEETIVELEEKAEETDEKVTEAAVKELAAVGHEPIEIPENEGSQTLSRADYEAQSAAITNPRDRARWRLANMHRITT